MPAYYYGSPKTSNSYDNALSILAAHDSVNSVRTSSLPLAQFWSPRDLEKRLSNVVFLQNAGIEEGELYFEFPTPVRRGIGKASMTDLLIRTKSYQIAVEAKYTEYVKSNYEKIGKWNKNNEKNKWDVVDGWLEYMGQKRGAIDIEKIKSVPYQLLHRVASAYAGKGNKRAVVVYQLFYDSTTESKIENFVDELKSGLEILSPRDLHFLVVKTKAVPPDDLKKKSGVYYLRMNSKNANGCEVYGPLIDSMILYEVDYDVTGKRRTLFPGCQNLTE